MIICIRGYDINDLSDERSGRGGLQEGLLKCTRMVCMRGRGAMAANDPELLKISARVPEAQDAARALLGNLGSVGSGLASGRLKKWMNHLRIDVRSLFGDLETVNWRPAAVASDTCSRPPDGRPVVAGWRPPAGRLHRTWNRKDHYVWCEESL